MEWWGNSWKGWKGWRPKWSGGKDSKGNNSTIILIYIMLLSTHSITNTIHLIIIIIIIIINRINLITNTIYIIIIIIIIIIN